MRAVLEKQNRLLKKQNREIERSEARRKYKIGFLKKQNPVYPSFEVVKEIFFAVRRIFHWHSVVPKVDAPTIQKTVHQ